MSIYKCENDIIIPNFRDCSLVINHLKYLLPNYEKKVIRRVYFKITDKCNLQCVYCFQKTDKKLDKTFNISEFSAVIDHFVSDFADEVVIFGGEPLLDTNKDILNEMFEYISSKSKILFYTNGCFSNNILEMLTIKNKSLHGLVISLDGPEKIHNERRIYVKKNSFMIIINNMKALRENDIPFIIQVNIDQSNYDVIDELLDYLYTLNNDFKSIEINLNRVLRMETSISEYELIKKYIEVVKKYSSCKISVNSKLLLNILDLFSGKGYSLSRCGIGDATLVFDFLSQVIYTCPQSSSTQVGIIQNDKVLVENERVMSMRNFARKSERIKCVNCEYLKICSQGCYLDVENVLCKEETEKMVKLIFENYNIFFIDSIT